MRKNLESDIKRMRSTSTQTVEQLLDRNVGGRPARRSARMGNSSSAGQINASKDEEASDQGNGARSSVSSSRERSSSASSSGSSSGSSNRESGQSTNNDASSRSGSLSEDSSFLETTTSTNNKDSNRASRQNSESRNGDRKKTSTQQKSSRSSRSRPSNGKSSKSRSNSRRINAYFVLEHDLERPPRRRTRPMEEGETIGDALFFGDDLMFGTLNEGLDRLKTPWPEYLRKRLVDEAGLRLLVSGLPGRTSRWDDEELAKSMGEWAKPDDFNGVRHFGTLFSSHTPLWVVIALGTNDLKTRIRTTAIESANEDEDFSFRLDLPPGKARVEAEQNGEEDDDAEYQFDADFVAGCVMSVALKAQHMFKGHCHEGNLRLLVVTPPPLRLTPSAMRAGFDMKSVELSQQLQVAFARKGKAFKLNVISPITSAEKLADGVHFTEEQARHCAEEVWKVMSMEIPRRTKRVERVDF